jgi:hypothetical protein
MAWFFKLFFTVHSLGVLLLFYFMEKKRAQEKKEENRVSERHECFMTLLSVTHKQMLFFPNNFFFRPRLLIVAG